MLAVTPQCLSTIICEGIHVHLGHQARIHLSKEEKLDHFHFSLSSKQMSCELSPRKKYPTNVRGHLSLIYLQ